ncbi:MAG: chorismate--pyruvate lyase family protein [Acidiferrobacterales bacterium]
MKAVIARPVEPDWLYRHQLQEAAVPAKIQDWLLDPASLTERLRAVCPGRFCVEVLAQRWSRPRLNESQELGMLPGRYGLVRQVYLRCSHKAWVFARTVIPATTLSGPERRLAYLRSRPLGAVLFADPTLKRARVAIERLVPGDALYVAATRGSECGPPVIWGRRSVFTINGKPLMVSEYFFPDIPPCKR